jgi:hypothetical protein
MLVRVNSRRWGTIGARGSVPKHPNRAILPSCRRRCHKTTKPATSGCGGGAGFVPVGTLADRMRTRPGGQSWPGQLSRAAMGAYARDDVGACEVDDDFVAVASWASAATWNDLVRGRVVVATSEITAVVGAVRLTYTSNPSGWSPAGPRECGPVRVPSAWVNASRQVALPMRDALTNEREGRLPQIGDLAATPLYRTVHKRPDLGVGVSSNNFGGIT